MKNLSTQEHLLSVVNSTDFPLRRIRKFLGYSQYEAGKIIGISQTQYSRVEAKKSLTLREIHSYYTPLASYAKQKQAIINEFSTEMEKKE